MAASAPAPLTALLAQIEGLVPPNAPPGERMSVFGPIGRIRQAVQAVDNRPPGTDAADQLVAIAEQVRGLLNVTRTLLNQWRGTVLPQGAPGLGFESNRSVLVARYEINGQSETFFGISGEQGPPGAVPRPGAVFRPQFVMIQGRGANLRDTDPEFELLNLVARRFGRVNLVPDTVPSLGMSGRPLVFPEVRGALYLISDFIICPSCQSAIRQFRAMFPNVRVEGLALRDPGRVTVT
jgi:hypothetical protein